MAAVATETAPALPPIADIENAAPAEATTTTETPAATAETPAAAAAESTEVAKSDKPASSPRSRRPLSNMFDFIKPKKSAKPAAAATTEPKAEQVSEKTVESIPAAPATTVVEPATVDIGAPVTAEESKAVPALVVADTDAPASTDAPVEAAKDEDKPAVSPMTPGKEKKQGFFDKFMAKRSSPKKSDELVAATETKEAEAKDVTPAAAAVAESTVAATETPAEAAPATLEAPAADAAPATAETTETTPAAETKDKAVKVGRRLSARVFGFASKKKESKAVDEAKPAAAADDEHVASATSEGAPVVVDKTETPAPVAKAESAPAAVEATPAATEVAPVTESAEPVKASEVLAAPVADEAVAPAADAAVVEPATADETKPVAVAA